MTIRITTGALVLLTFGGPDAGTPAHGERDTIRLVARLRVARAAATATTIAGDRVLIAGGMAEGGAAVRSYEVFGARSNTVVTVGDMGEQRVGHTATFLPDGRVLVIGGYNGAYLKSAEIFDPRLGRFAPAGTMREGRSGHTATLLRDGTVLV
ncbi:MAG: kelch repeat-containing protein, partial [Gemmatimonadota bacterium]|nr:kelch repeat-containing protein [Gemmatimonadota bacterium]